MSLLVKNNIGIVDGLNETRYENAGSATAKGFEIELNHNFSSQLSAFMNYTYQNPQVSNINKQVVAVPKQLFRVGIMYNGQKWTSSLTGEYVSKRYGYEDNSDVLNGVYGSYDPYFIMNFSIGYKIQPNCELSLGIRNLLNRNFCNYYYQEGRTYEVQLNCNF